MEVRCDQCQARYRVDDARVGPKGLAMRCGKCGNTFRLAQDGTVTKPAGTKASSIPTPGTATPLATPQSPPRKPVAAATLAPPAVAAQPPPLSVPAPATPAATRVPLAASPSSVTATPAPTPVPRSEAAVPSAPPREARVVRPPATSAPASKVQRPPRSMQLEGAPSGGPPRNLVVGVAIALVGLAVMFVVFGFWRQHRPPPPAAVEALNRAKAVADKDSLAALAEAESQATAAIEAAPRGYPAAYAELAMIDVAWADALDDEAYFSTERAERAGRAGDDRTRLDADGKASAFQDQAKGRLRPAFEAAVAGNRLDPKSPDAALALADYYRAARSRTNMNLELKRAANLGADPASIAFVQGADLLGQEDGFPQAVEKLEAAVKGAPDSARLRFRLSMAYVKAQRTSDAQNALQETLRLSPAHERAKLALEALAGRAETRDGKKR